MQPDVALFCEQTNNKQYFSKTLPLIVEVLYKSTLLKDVTTKFTLYETQGVRYYLIIDPNSELVDVFKLIEGEYALMGKYTKEDSYAFGLFDGYALVVDFGDVFG